MQPKLEPQPILFDQQQAQQIKMSPITNNARFDLPQSNFYTCSLCTQPIHERYLLYTQDRLSRGNYWHMQCLRCQCCDAVLADISSTFYTKDNALLCKSDYMKRYGSRPCSHCGQLIGVHEQVMRVSPNYVYHLHCFSCIKCHARLVKGDRYVSFNGQLFCEKDNPLKSNTNNKRANQTSKRGAKAAATRAAAAAAVTTQTPSFVNPPPFSPNTSMNYPPTTNNPTHLHGQSLLNPTNSNNGPSGSSTTDEMY